MKIMLGITDDSSYKIFSHMDDSGNYVVKLSNTDSNYLIRILDLITYCMEFKIPLNYDLNKHEENYLHNNLQNHNIRGPLRDYEPEVLIHSSTKELSESIIKSGELLSWNSAKERKLLKEETPIGKDLGDPEDFKNYVMLGSPGVVSEIVVLSKYLKKLCFDENHVYEPGVRFYFDAKKLASDNILVRDGLHLKVRDGFKINKYLIHKVFPSSDVEWTPKSFSEYADQIVLDKGQ